TRPQPVAEAAFERNLLLGGHSGGGRRFGSKAYLDRRRAGSGRSVSLAAAGRLRVGERFGASGPTEREGLFGGRGLRPGRGSRHVLEDRPQSTVDQQRAEERHERTDVAGRLSSDVPHAEEEEPDGAEQRPREDPTPGPAARGRRREREERPRHLERHHGHRLEEHEGGAVDRDRGVAQVLGHERERDDPADRGAIARDVERARRLRPPVLGAKERPLRRFVPSDEERKEEEGAQERPVRHRELEQNEGDRERDPDEQAGGIGEEHLALVKASDRYLGLREPADLEVEERAREDDPDDRADRERCDDHGQSTRRPVARNPVWPSISKAGRVPPSPTWRPRSRSSSARTSSNRRSLSALTVRSS